MGRGWEAAAAMLYQGAYLRSFSRREIRECVWGETIMLSKMTRRVVVGKARFLFEDRATPLCRDVGAGLG